VKIDGGCYCVELRYEACGNALFKGQYHGHKCQYICAGIAAFDRPPPEA